MVPAITARDEKIATVRADAVMTGATRTLETGGRAAVATTTAEDRSSGIAPVGTSPAVTATVTGMAGDAGTRHPGAARVSDPVAAGVSSLDVGRTVVPAGPTGPAGMALPLPIVRAADPGGRPPDATTTGRTPAGAASTRAAIAERRVVTTTRRRIGEVRVIVGTTAAAATGREAPEAERTALGT